MSKSVLSEEPFSLDFNDFPSCLASVPIDVDGEMSTSGDERKDTPMFPRKELIENVETPLFPMEETAERMQDLESRVEVLEAALEKVVERLNGNKRTSREVVTQAEFERFVDEAVSHRDFQDLGVSKIFLRRFLQSNHDLTDSRYTRRRLNAVLKQKVDMKEYRLEGALYSKVPKE